MAGKDIDRIREAESQADAAVAAAREQAESLARRARDGVAEARATALERFKAEAEAGRQALDAELEAALGTITSEGEQRIKQMEAASGPKLGQAAEYIEKEILGGE